MHEGRSGGRSGGGWRDLQVGAAPWFRSSGSAPFGRGKPGAAALVTHAPAQVLIWISKGRGVPFISAPVRFTLMGGWQLGGLCVSYHSFK